MNAAHIHADESLRCVVDSNQLAWQASPSPLVQRRLLARDGGEVARATSIVRYAPGAQFALHTHERGEEIWVLEGSFGDALGEYGTGCYLLNPPGSSHAPFSVEGCTLFVKLRHLQAQDSARVVVDTAHAQARHHPHGLGALGTRHRVPAAPALWWRRDFCC